MTVLSFALPKRCWRIRAVWKDPIVEEVRSIREKQAEACGFDIRRIVAEAEAKQRTSGHPLVSFAKGKRPPAKRKATQP